MTRLLGWHKLRTRAILQILHSHCLIIPSEEIVGCALAYCSCALLVAEILAVLLGRSGGNLLLKACLSMLIRALAQISRILMDGFTKITGLVTNRCSLSRSSQVGLAERQTSFQGRVSCIGLR